MAQNTEVVIVNGPSRWDLMLALFDREGGGIVREVLFKLAEVEGIYGSLSSAELVSENLWRLCGVVFIGPDLVPFAATYSDQTRTGSLTILVDQMDTRATAITNLRARIKKLN